MNAQPGDPLSHAASVEGADARIGEALKAAGPHPGSPIHETKERIVGDAREAVLGAASDSKSAAAAFLGDISQALSDAGTKLAERGRPRSAHYAAVAGDALRRFGDDVSQRDLGDLLGDVERFARDRPAVFLGAMFAAGFGAARFLRASGGADEHGVGGGHEVSYDAQVQRAHAAGPGAQI